MDSGIVGNSDTFTVPGVPGHQTFLFVSAVQEIITSCCCERKTLGKKTEEVDMLLFIYIFIFSK